MMKPNEKQTYRKPSVETVSSRQVIESLGVAHGGTYQAIDMDDYGD